MDRPVITSNRLKRKYRSNEVIVNTKSNFKSHLVRCQALMDDSRVEQVILRAMGKATTRAVNLALQLNENNFNTFEIKPMTSMVEILEDIHKRPIKGTEKDLFDPNAISENDKKINKLPVIEIVVRKSQLELDKMKK